MSNSFSPLRPEERAAVAAILATASESSAPPPPLPATASPVPPSKPPLNFSIDGVSYTGTFLGNGTFNEVYKFSKDGRERVLKVPTARSSREGTALSAPERAVRLAQEVTPALNAELVDVTLLSDGRTLPLWIADFQTSADATLRDAEIAASVLEIYQRTDRIVLDARVKGNFMAVEDPVTAQRRELCVDVDQAMRRGSVVSDDFLARMKWKVWLMKGEATVLRSVVSGLMDAVFNFSESELTPEEKSQLIKNLAKKSIIDLLVAMQDLEKKIRLEQKYLRLDSLSDLERNESEAKIAGFRSGQSQYSADIKLFIPFLSLENISILGAELLEQDFNLQFGWLMESFETTGDITKTTVSEEISHRVMQGLEVLDEDEISKRLQVLISLYQVEGVPVNAESIETLKALLPGSEADKQRRFLDLIEDLVRDFLILEKPLNRGALASLIPGEQLREDIIFSAKVNLSAKETLLSGGPLEKISGFIQDEGRSETAKACALSEGKYIESNITRHLELERYLEFLRDCDVNPRLVESQVAAKFKEELRSRLVIIGLLDSMHESPEKVRLIFSQANRLNRLDPEALTPQEMAKNIYQLERVLSHKKYQPRKWGNHSSDFMANAERIESLRTLYEQAFPGIPLVPQEEILRPKEITAAGAQDVLTFKQMLAQTAAPAAMTPTQPERRERGGTDDLMPATRT